MERRMPQRAWEQQLQQQQAELERRELAVQAQEKKHAGLQAKADDLRRREDALKLREEQVAEMTLRCEGVVASQATMREREEALAEATADLNRRAAALEARTMEQSRDVQVRESELAQRLADVTKREERVEALHREQREKLEVVRLSVEQRASELQSIEHELKLRRVQLSDEHSHLQQWSMELRTKEEEHEQYEKLIRDFQAADERARRQIKWLEDDLQRRQVELRVAREDLAAETVQLQVLQVQVEEKESAAEAMTKQARAELATAEQKAKHVSRAESLVADREAQIAEQELEIRRRLGLLEVREKAVSEQESRLVHQRREAEIDMKRAQAVRNQSAEAERKSALTRQAQQQREKELHAWDDELDWREAELGKMLETAMNLPRAAGEGQPAPSHHNAALLASQLHQMRDLYNAGHQRRVISALQPHNRAGSASSRSIASQRTCTPMPRPSKGLQDREGKSHLVGSSSSSSGGRNMAISWESTHFRESRPLVLQCTDRGGNISAGDHAYDEDVNAEAHLLALRQTVHQLEKDMKFFSSKLLMLRSSTQTDDEREALMAKHFTARERTAIEVALQRERDVGAEVAFHLLVQRCPLNTPVADPNLMSKRLATWWREVRHAVSRRSDALLRERHESLVDAVDVLRRKAPQLAAEIKRARHASLAPLTEGEMSSELVLPPAGTPRKAQTGNRSPRRRRPSTSQDLRRPTVRQRLAAGD